VRHLFPVVTASFLAAFAAGAVFGLKPGTEAVQAEEGAVPAQKFLLQVQGLSCASCEEKIRSALRAIPGVRSVAVNLADRTVTVEYQDGSADPKALADAVTRAGYPARYVTSGPGVPNAGAPGRKPSGGCGGGCCDGKS